MANKNLFASATSVLPRADALNEAGGRAYDAKPTATRPGPTRGHRLLQRHLLRRRLRTSSATLLDLAAQVDDNGFPGAAWRFTAASVPFMKDMPAALLLVLARARTSALFRPCVRSASWTTAACCGRCFR